MKIKKYLILAILLLCCIKLPTFASEVIEDEQHDTIVEKVFEDNSYVESYIMETEKGIQTRSSKKSGDKVYVAKSSSGKTIWTATLHGDFTYTGTSAKCTSTTLSTSVSNKNWKIKKKNHYASGASAIGIITAKKYVDNSAIKTMNITLKLTCSSNGKLK